MTRMTIVDDRNQDDMSRKAGCYLYVDTRLWLANNAVHRSDGPAVIFPDGVERWYIHGKEVTRDVKTYFFQNKWPSSGASTRLKSSRSFLRTFLNNGAFNLGRCLTSLLSSRKSTRLSDFRREDVSISVGRTTPLFTTTCDAKEL